MKKLVTEFSRVLVFIDSIRDKFLKFLEMRLSPKNCLRGVFVLQMSARDSCSTLFVII